MRIDLAPFRGARHRSVEVHNTFRVAPGPAPSGTGVVAEPATVAVTAAGGPQRVRVRVEATLRLRCPCDRCLDDVALQVPVAYTEEWRLPGGRRGGAPAADEGDDAEVVRRAVAGDGYDLDEGFWQNVSLEMPAKVLCRDGCRGLCPVCGANRNRQSCDCRVETGDPRLAALADWRPGPRR